MAENVSKFIALFVFAVWLLILVRMAVRFFRNQYAPVKTVRAVVVDKQKIDMVSKYSGTGKRHKYVVVFSAGDKKLSFYVSEFSYAGYRLKERGTLTYKGDRILDFQ